VFSEREVLSSLPLQMALFFNVFLSIFFMSMCLSLLRFKVEALRVESDPIPSVADVADLD